jgi:hypothetical protein
MPPLIPPQGGNSAGKLIPNSFPFIFLPSCGGVGGGFYFFKKARIHATLSSHSCENLRSRKEVFQPHLPVRLPCYDLAPVTSFTLGRSLRLQTSGTPGSHGLTGGVYKARERIHRAMADARLLANPTSRSRVADFDPNWDRL